MELNQAVRSALTSGHLAHLVTIEANGLPHVTMVWVGLEGDEIVCGHPGALRKVANVRRNPAVALSMETGHRNVSGFDEYLIIYGKARVTEGGAADLLHRLAEVYLGPNVRFPRGDDPSAGYVTRITVDRVAGVGPWRD